MIDLMTDMSILIFEDLFSCFYLGFFFQVVFFFFFPCSLAGRAIKLYLWCSTRQNQVDPFGGGFFFNSVK